MNAAIRFSVMLGFLSAAPGVVNAESFPLRSERFLLGPTVVVDATGGAVRLAHSVLVTDEMGAADFRQQEKLSDQVQAKKVFVLDDDAVTKAELFLFGSAKQIDVNGKPLGTTRKLESTGWNRLEIPKGVLKRGENEVVLHGGGSLLVDCVPAGRSFKSTDGGRTWSKDNLTSGGAQHGEYLIRLRLGRYAREGWAMSEAIDLWQQSDQVGAPAKLVRIAGMKEIEKQPAGSSVQVFLRTGSTPQPDVKTWTNWLSLNNDYEPALDAQSHRWAQLKFMLQSDRAQTTPQLPAQLNLECQLQPEQAGADVLKVSFPEGRTLSRTSLPFVYQEPSPRLKLLRERYKLDEVIAPGETELEKLMLLRHWVRNQWHTAWKGGAASWMPPWDAHIILESKDQSDCLTMCTHYAAVYTQCCLALGWNARHCIVDHHCVSEVWMDQFNKWVMMDPGNSAKRPDANLHYELEGVPLSARELHVLWRSGKTKAIQVRFTPKRLMEKIANLCRPAPKELPERPDSVTLAELEEYPVCHIQNFRRYGFPARNNYLASLFPGELYQGMSAYYYDGYWWVGDDRDDPQVSPEYSLLLDPVRSRDIDWSVNQTAIHLSRTGKPGVLRVDLETTAPNLARYEKSTTANQWQKTPVTFTWQLQPGSNEMQVRSTNAWDKSGRPATVRVEWNAQR